MTMFDLCVLAPIGLVLWTLALWLTLAAVGWFHVEHSKQRGRLAASNARAAVAEERAAVAEKRAAEAEALVREMATRQAVRTDATISALLKSAAATGQRMVAADSTAAPPAPPARPAAPPAWVGAA